MSSIGKNKPLAAKILKKALMKLECSIGFSAVEMLLYDLENQGIALEGDSGTHYSLQQIEDALKRILGEEAAAIIIWYISKILERNSEELE